MKALRRIAAGLALTVGASSLGGIWYGKYFINQKLTPNLEKILSRSIQRPVSLGKVTYFSSDAIHFGASRIDSTPTQLDFATIDRIELQTNPWALLQRRQVRLAAKLIRPHVFLPQTWRNEIPQLSLPTTAFQENWLDLHKIVVVDGQLTLGIREKDQLVTIAGIKATGKLSLLDSQRQTLAVSGGGNLFVAPWQNVNDPKRLNIHKYSQSQGQLQVLSQWDLSRGQGQIQLQTANLQMPAIAKFLPPLPIAVLGGQLQGDIGVRFLGKPEPDVQVALQMSAGRLQVSGGRVLEDITAKILFDGMTASLRSVAGKFETLQFRAEGTATAKAGLDLDIAIPNIDLSKTAQQLNIPLPVPVAGMIDITGRIKGKKPTLEATVTSSQPLTIDRVLVKKSTINATTNNFQDWQVTDLVAQTDLGAVNGSGMFQVAGQEPRIDLRLASSDIAAEAVADRYKLALPMNVGIVSGALQIAGGLQNLEWRLQGQAPQAKYPIAGGVRFVGNTATLENVEIALPEGRIQAEGSLDRQTKRWQTNLSTDRLTLPDATVKGTIDVVSPQGGFALSDLTVTAKVQLPQGITRLPKPIGGEATWNGQNLKITNLAIENFLAAQGTATLKFDEQKQPAGLASLDLQLQTQEKSLAQLRTLLPNINIPQPLLGKVRFSGQVSGNLENFSSLKDLTDLQKLQNLIVQGKLKASEVTIAGEYVPQGVLDFEGTVAGQITDPTLSGQVTLDGLAYQQIAFAPRLAGTVQAQMSSGLNIDLRGQQDQIAFTLDKQWRPQEIAIRLKNASAIGKNLDNQLVLAIKQFPIGLVAAPLGQTELSGDLSGTLEIALSNNLTTLGSVTIDRPSYGRIQAERLTTKIAYNNGNAYLKDGKIEMLLPEHLQTDSKSEYQFEVDYTPKAVNQIAGTIGIKNGDIQDISRLMQWQEWEDIGKGLQAPHFAKAVALSALAPVGIVDQSLQDQLNYFLQIQKRLIQQEVIVSQRNPLAPLSALRGHVSGKVKFKGSSKQGAAVRLDLEGKEWEYGKLAVENLVLQGEINTNALLIDTLKFQSGDSKGELKNSRLALVDPKSGRLGNLEGNLELVKFPIESLRPLPFLRTIPVEVTGMVNGTATLGGNLLQPQASGNLELKDGTVSQQPINSASGSFDYALGRLKFDSTVLVNGPTPVRLSGDIPLRIGYVFPGSNLKVDVTVADEALAFINFINPTFRWLSGKGNAKITVTGTPRQPRLEGVAELQQAVVQVAGLPGNVTDLSGKLLFDFDRVTSDLAGRFSEGKVLVKGTLAITNDQLQTEAPLQVDAEKLKLDLKDTYAGNFDGTVVVGGSLQSPVLSGTVSLSEGRIFLSEKINGNGSSKEASQKLGLQNLNVQLLENVQITRPPLLNLLGKGTVEVNGTLEDLRPSGKIRISRGQINAISARFHLDRSYDSFAEFIPSQGLDPNLNIRLLGTVPEITRPPIQANPFDTINLSSIPVSNLGAQRTLQLQATLTGKVSTPSISLRSSPPRTESEILALIGGGLLVQTGGDPTATLVNLAGGTVISFFQDTIGNILNLSEFNLSPVTTSADARRLSALGLAAEGAIDLGKDISFSIRSVINDPSQTTNYTLRYRFNPNTLLRTNTDFQGNNSTTIEFESRF